MSKTFTVAVDIYTDEDEIEYIIPSVAELDELEKAIEEDQEEVELFIQGEGDQKVIGKAREAAHAKLKRDIERKRKIREAYKDKATRTGYSLRVPTYGMYLDAESVARSTDEDGTPRIDESLLMRELLTACLVNGNAMELSPAVARVLYNKLQRRAFPDVDRLPFK